MKKNYLKPEMELTECIMLRTGICSAVQQNGGNDPNMGNPNSDPYNNAPGKKVF